MTYEWKRKTIRGKRVVLLLGDGKKKGSIAVREDLPHLNQDYEWCTDLKYRGYAGGKPLGEFQTMTDAKIAVEKELCVSTKKQKQRKQPVRV